MTVTVGIVSGFDGVQPESTLRAVSCRAFSCRAGSSIGDGSQLGFPSQSSTGESQNTSPVDYATGLGKSVRRGFCEAQSNNEVLTTNLSPSPALGA